MGGQAFPGLRELGMAYEDLRTAEGLARLDAAFLERLGREAPALRGRLEDWRAGPEPPRDRHASAFLLALAPHVEGFLAWLFGIEAELAASRGATLAENAVARFKESFVLKRARRRRGPFRHSFEALDRWLDEALAGAGLADLDRELAVARYGLALLEDEDANADLVERLTEWCALALQDPAGSAAVRGWVSFRLPARVDYARLVPVECHEDAVGRRCIGEVERLRRRDGFALTDPRASAREVQDQVHYCVYCHTHEGDFCSRGFPERKGDQSAGLKVNPLGVVLTGCPLDERISEMHWLKREGRTIAALAMAMADNPMLPATGHRICNDCMKGCIYQKQDPVDIPQIETRVLTDVLALPWGVEVYDLLTRWNPLRHRQHRMRPWNGRRVLVAGMGPAGFTMAHHLTMEGCAVVGIDGLKIEPLPEAWVRGPVRDWQEMVEPLDRRILYGFGGVAEYGITVRWDKNLLKLIYLTLLRRPTFQVFGGVRFGGTLTIEDAWALGFDHVVNACGTGLPRVLNIGNSLARGMRQASDFLMALQLTGAAKDDSLANLQVRLPAVVIGGGLTAVDTATEVQAYYIRQVEKVAARYERLVAELGEDRVRGLLEEEDRAILDEFLAHAEAVRAERARAAAVGEAPDFVPLLRRWGGVTICYRRGLNESPAYIRNHEEIVKAMEEGIYYREGLDPLRLELDRWGHVEAVVFRRRRKEAGRWLDTREEVRLRARSVFVAAGALPNTLYEREHPGTFALDEDHFRPHVLQPDGLQPVAVAAHCKEPVFGPFTSYEREGRLVSFVGDTHPVFHGSVVKAIASAARSWPHVVEAMARLPARPADEAALARFRARMEDLLTARVERAEDRGGVTELYVRAPMAARSFAAGQFFRLQTYESAAPVVEGTRLAIPLQTVSGAGVEDEALRLFVFRFGGPSRLVARLRPGERIVLMGPSGAPTPTGRGRTVLVVTGSWGAAVMLGLGPALRAAGDRVLLLAAFAEAGQVLHREELEAAADQVIWATARAPGIEPRRPQDLGVVEADLVAVLRRYAEGALRPAEGRPLIPLAAVDEVLVMGGTGLLRAFQRALAPGGALAGAFRPGVEAFGTVGSPMQCMLKGVCAQCLQWQVDPRTGRRTRAVFSCAEQDQPLLRVDLDNLAARQAQNRLQDRLGDLWLTHVLRRAEGA